MNHLSQIRPHMMVLQLNFETNECETVVVEVLVNDCRDGLSVEYFVLKQIDLQWGL